MARPKPVPPGLVVKKGSKARRPASSDIPGPLSPTEIDTPRSSSSASSASTPPEGITSRAFSTRFKIARRSMSRSAVISRPSPTVTAAWIRWAANCGANEPSTSSASFFTANVCRCGSRSAVKFNRSLTVTSSAAKPAAILSSTSRLPGSAEIRRRKRLR